MIAGVEGMGHFQKVLQQMSIALVTLGGVAMLIICTYLIAATEEEFKTVLSFCVVLLIASIPVAVKVLPSRSPSPSASPHAVITI